MPRAKLAKLSVEELKKEIMRRRKALPALIAKRDALNCQIAELQALGAVQPAAKSRNRGMRKVRRAPKAGSLAGALIDVLTAKGRLSVADAATAVQAAGYKSKSKDFRNIVGMTLSQRAYYKRVGRGVYSLKG
jgi:chorismate mutase